MEESIFEIVNELSRVREELEDFNNINLDKILILLSELNRTMKNIDNSLRLIADG